MEPHERKVFEENDWKLIMAAQATPSNKTFREWLYLVHILTFFLKKKIMAAQATSLLVSDFAQYLY
jgi:hypothetical protein